MTEEKTEEKAFYTLEEAAAYIGVSRATVFNYLKDLRIKPTKFKRDRKAYLSLEVVKSIQTYKENPSSRPRSAEKRK